MIDSGLIVTEVGSPITIGKDIRGIITSVMIKEGPRLRYEVAWWAGKTHHCEWFEECELAAAENSHSIKVGFKAKGRL